MRLPYRYAKSYGTYLFGLDNPFFLMERDGDKNNDRNVSVVSYQAINLLTDADDATTRIEQRAVRVAGINGNVGLDTRPEPSSRSDRPFAFPMPGNVLCQTRMAIESRKHTRRRHGFAPSILAIGKLSTMIISNAVRVAESLPSKVRLNARRPRCMTVNSGASRTTCVPVKTVHFRKR